MTTQTNNTEIKDLWAYERKDIEGTHFGITDNLNFLENTTIIKKIKLNKEQLKEVERAKQVRLKQLKQEQEVLKSWLK